MSYFKKICVLFLIFITTFSQTAFGFQFFWSNEVEAAGPSSLEQKDLVAIFVDQSIYGAIQWDLDWYANVYIPKQTSNVKPLIFPINTAGFTAKDIHRILENLYFEWEKGKNSKLAWVILFGNVPMPIIELNGERLQSIYPYTNFVDPMFLYDDIKQVFAFNNHPESLPQVRHSVIPWSDAWLFTNFFTKLKSYSASPSKYSLPKIWIDDFPLMKDSFTDQERNDYINSLLFAEYDGSRRLNQAYNNVLDKDNRDQLIKVVEKAKSEIEEFEGEKSEAWEHPEVDDIAKRQFNWAKEVVDRFKPAELIEWLKNSSKKPLPTLILEKVIGSHFRPVHQLFGTKYIEYMQKNPLAWGRYNLEDIDSSLEKIQIKDTVSKQYLKDMNDFMEELLDSEVKKKKRALKYPLPVLHQKRESMKVQDLCSLEIPEQITPLTLLELFGPPPGVPVLQWPFAGSIVGISKIWPDTFLTRYLKEEYQNFYFGKNALIATGYQQLSPYRWSWLNIKDNLDSQPVGIRGILDDIPYDINKFSAGVWLGWLTQQTKSLRAFNFDLIYPELDLKKATQCDDSDTVNEWSYKYRGWWSPLNVDQEYLKSDPTDLRPHRDYYNPRQMWNPFYVEQIPGAKKPIPPAPPLWSTFPIFSTVAAQTSNDDMDGDGLWNQEDIDMDGDGKNDDVDDDVDGDNILNGIDTDIDADGINNGEDSDTDGDRDANREDEDIDGDRIPNTRDSDMDGDRKENQYDLDIDGDQMDNNEDIDIDGDGLLNAVDRDIDGDGIENSKDNDMNGNSVVNVNDPDMDGDAILSDLDDDIDGDGIGNCEDSDIDSDGVENASDVDTDGDWLQNTTDKYPLGRCSGSQPNLSAFDAAGDGFQLIISQSGSCSGEPNDIDTDGIINESDSDLDGDGLSNAIDSDIDADGIMNRQDDDIDCDGKKNSEDDDIDADGLDNKRDRDSDCDGRKNSSDSDSVCSGRMSRYQWSWWRWNSK
jgi:hypothetical protein